MEQARAIAGRVEQSLRQPESSTHNPTKSPSDRCSHCGGAGWIVDSDRAVRCGCTIEREVRSSLPPRYHAAKLCALNPELRERIGRWLEAPGDGLFLSGPAGCGKTFAAAAIVRARIEQRRKCAFLPMRQLYSDLREAFRTNASEKELLRPHLRAEMIVLDDVGAGALSDFERRAALDVIDERLNSALPTIVTTNLDLSEIAARIDDRLASRLSSYELLRLAGHDRRCEKIVTFQGGRARGAA